MGGYASRDPKTKEDVPFQPKHKSTGAQFNGGLPDGVAIFWNTQRVKFVRKVPVGWNNTGSLHDASEDHAKDGKRAKQVAKALQLQMKEGTKQKFLMMTAHVKSGELDADKPAKISQGREVARIMAAYNKTMPVIFACDFNNRPGGDAHAAFFRELRTGHCSKTGCEYNILGNIDAECQGDRDGRCTVCKSDWIGADTNVTSAYSKVLGTHKNTVTNEKAFVGKEWTNCTMPTYDQMMASEPKFTTMKWRKGGTQKDKRGKTIQTIDFIFYTSNGLECKRVLNMPMEEIEPDLHMPGWKYPSDHFMIGADLEFTRFKGGRRRMAQREFSNRRDSPVMTRLLKEIIDAQDN